MVWRDAPARETWPGLVVRTHGAVPAADMMHTIAGVSRALRAASASSTGCVRISRRHLRGVLYQVNADINGRPCRVQIMGPASAAVERFSRHVDGVRTGRAARFLPYPENSVLHTATPPQPVVRRKAVQLLTLAPAAASEVMYRMDFATFLFRDADTGDSAVVYRTGAQQVGLIRRTRACLPCTDTYRIAVDNSAAEAVPESVAAERLCRNGLPFLFFADPRTARGRLMYRRFDGYLAVLEPHDRP